MGQNNLVILGTYDRDFIEETDEDILSRLYGFDKLVEDVSSNIDRKRENVVQFYKENRDMFVDLRDKIRTKAIEKYGCYGSRKLGFCTPWSESFWSENYERDFSKIRIENLVRVLDILGIPNLTLKTKNTKGKIFNLNDLRSLSSFIKDRKSWHKLMRRDFISRLGNYSTYRHFHADRLFLKLPLINFMIMLDVLSYGGITINTQKVLSSYPEIDQDYREMWV